MSIIGSETIHRLTTNHRQTVHRPDNSSQDNSLIKTIHRPDNSSTIQFTDRDKSSTGQFIYETNHRQDNSSMRQIMDTTINN